MNRNQVPENRIPQQKAIAFAALQGMVMDAAGRPIPGVQVQLTGVDGRKIPAVVSSGDGIFRILRIPAGSYELLLTRRDGGALKRPQVELRAGEVLSVEVHMTEVLTNYVNPLPQEMVEVADETQYKELSRRPDADGAVIVAKETPLAPAGANFQPQRDRWEVPFPDNHR